MAGTWAASMADQVKARRAFADVVTAVVALTGALWFGSVRQAYSVRLKSTKITNRSNTKTGVESTVGS